jgi:hypothetical protein
MALGSGLGLGSGGSGAPRLQIGRCLDQEPVLGTRDPGQRQPARQSSICFGTEAAVRGSLPANRRNGRAGSLCRAGRHCSRIDDERVLNFVVMRAAATGTCQPQSEQARLAQRIGLRLEPGLHCLTSAWTAKRECPHAPPLSTLRFQPESVLYAILRIFASVSKRGPRVVLAVI